MSKPPGAGQIWTSCQGVQKLDILYWDTLVKNFPKVLEIFESWLDDPNASKAEKQQAMKFFSEECIRAMKECRGKTAKDFENRVTTQKSTREKQVGRGGNGGKGSNTLQLLKTTYDPEDKDTGTDN